MPKTGVYPVFENKFKIMVDTEYAPIAEMESFSVAIDGQVRNGRPLRPKAGSSA